MAEHLADGAWQADWLDRATAWARELGFNGVMDALASIETARARSSEPMAGKYGDVLTPFVAMMERELHANAGKGDRPGWLQMTPAVGMLEIYYHAAKLQKAVKDGNAAGIREYGADVANMAMMLVDVCGALFDQVGEAEPTVRNDRMVAASAGGGCLQVAADHTDAAIQKAASDLPDGFMIAVGVERHAGWVDLFDPAGEVVEFPTNRESIADQISDALEHVLSAQREEAQDG